IETLGSEAPVEYGAELLEHPPLEEAGDSAVGKDVSMLSSSDHSDIVTLGDLKDDEHPEVGQEAAASEESYLGMSCSSQYAFTPAETVFPVQQPAVTNSSSSEDEAGRSSSTVIRRRRLRKNTTSAMAEPEEEEEARESGPSDGEVEEKEVNQEKKQEVQADVTPAAAPDFPTQGQSSSVLNRCILLALIIAMSMGFGHFYGKTFAAE
uniref:Cell cycle progression 1 n=1 Tax=Mastacembelus armatus TaxID=205130 RepID=A0A7N9AKX7_9TELE